MRMGSQEVIVTTSNILKSRWTFQGILEIRRSQEWDVWTDILKNIKPPVMVIGNINNQIC